MIDELLVTWLYCSYFGIFKNSNPFPSILTSLVLSTKANHIKYGLELKEYLHGNQ